MTREEIIRNLQYTMEKHKNDTVPTFGTNISLMCKEILDYLEREPCEDAINRKGLISHMEGVRSHYYKNGKIDGYKNLPTEMKIRIDEVDYLIGQIEDAPPVQPKPKIGHWIEYTRVLIPEPINRWEQAWYCSECGYGNQECEDGSAWLEWKYCPNCGARMVKPQGSGE